MLGFFSLFQFRTTVAVTEALSVRRSVRRSITLELKTRKTRNYDAAVGIVYV